jgi:hypothetical protein
MLFDKLESTRFHTTFCYLKIHHKLQESARKETPDKQHDKLIDKLASARFHATFVT